MQRRLFQQAARGADFEIEEQCLVLLDRVLRSAYSKPAEPVVKRDAVHHVEMLLSNRWDRTLRLGDLAKEAGVSVFHLCRMFRRATGTSLHQYRKRLRILSALEPVSESRRPLIDIAIDAGFSSHSHFTSEFRREFGRRPSDVRQG